MFISKRTLRYVSDRGHHAQVGGCVLMQVSKCLKFRANELFRYLERLCKVTV
jgi:N-methylhydantoinase B/oxoprolinase/acetone carboxylase alpha subunit